MESTGLCVSTKRVVFPGPTPSTIQRPPPPDGLRGLDEAHLAAGGVEDEVDTPATGQPRDFGGDVVAGLRTATRTPNRFPLSSASTAPPSCEVTRELGPMRPAPITAIFMPSTPETDVA